MSQPMQSAHCQPLPAPTVPPHTSVTRPHLQEVRKSLSEPSASTTRPGHPTTPDRTRNGQQICPSANRYLRSKRSVRCTAPLLPVTAHLLLPLQRSTHTHLPGCRSNQDPRKRGSFLLSSRTMRYVPHRQPSRHSRH